MSYWYKGLDGLYHINGNVVSPGLYILKVYKDKTAVALEDNSTYVLLDGPIEIVNIQKEDDSYYIDLDDLLATLVDFFSAIVVPFQSDLDTWHKTIIDTTFAESIENLPAKFLPRVASFNGTDDKISWGSVLLNHATIWSIAIKGLNFTNIAQSFIIGGLGSENLLLFYNGKIGHRAEDGSYKIWDGTANSLDVPSPNVGSFFSLVFYADGTNIYVVFNGTYKGYIIPFNTNLYFNKFVKGFTDNSNGCNGDYTDLRVWNTNIGQTEALLFHNDEMTSNPNVYAGRLTGQGDYEYDLSGTGNHSTWSGTGARYAYDLEGSTYLNVNGYSLWQHATLPDIQVPFDISGNALVLTPGTDIPTGYTKTRDVQPGGSKWNMADSLVGFNEDESANSALEIFDRSNVTRQTAVSRASDYYDNTNLATRSRYHVSEIADPRIYDTFFEALFKDLTFGKVVLAANDDVIRWDEHSQYENQKTGDDLLTVQEYCGIADIYP